MRLIVANRKHYVALGSQRRRKLMQAFRYN